VGAAALGIAAYYANEIRKDDKVRKEQEEAETLKQDRIQAYLQRKAESEMKERGDNLDAHFRGLRWGSMELYPYTPTRRLI